MWIRALWVPDALKAFVPEASRVDAVAHRRDRSPDSTQRTADRAPAIETAGAQAGACRHGRRKTAPALTVAP